MPNNRDEGSALIHLSFAMKNLGELKLHAITLMNLLDPDMKRKLLPIERSQACGKVLSAIGAVSNSIEKAMKSLQS